MRLNRLEPVLRRALRGPCRLPAGSRVLVAVSGGADSTALLLGLHRLAREFELEVHCAHLDHGLRGTDSAGDLAFVRALCRARSIPFVGAKWDARRRMKLEGLAGEAGLRTIRREFLLAAAGRIGAAAIATAHTADDQLETVLMRLARGTGLRGLGGMRPRHGLWIKPLLEAARADVEADLAAAGQRWREDATNQGLEHARNRVRHLVVPALLRALGMEEAGRAGLARRFARASREARDADRALRAWISPLLPGLSSIQGNEFELDSKRLGSYPDAFRRTVLRTSWRRLEPAGPGLTHDHLRALDQLIRAPRGKRRVLLPCRRYAERDGGTIRFGVLSSPSAPGPVPLDVPGRTRWGSHLVRSRWETGLSARNNFKDNPLGMECFAADGLQGTLEVRAGRADEEFVPFGRRTPVRLGDFLRKQRVSRDTDRGPGVLADSGGILWVIGVRRSARAPVTRETRRVLRIQAERT